MNKSRPENTAPKPIQAEDALRSLSAGVGQLDGDRAAAYGELSTLRSARQSSLERREKIYAVKYGATDRRVLQVQKQRETNLRLRQEIYVAHTQAATPAPTVDENGYVFHGFVRNCDRQPLARLTVALYDEKGQWLRELGYGCTDDNGYFILRFQRDAKPTRGDQKNPAGTVVNSGTESSGLTAEIRVYDAKQTLLQREARLLTPKLGNVDYREITIDDCGDRCTPPPGSTDDPPPPAPEKPPPAPRVPPNTPIRPAPAIPPPPPVVPPPQARVSTPLENIKGVGPKTAAKLRATGIEDVEELRETKTEKLIALAGTDKKVTDSKPKPRPVGATKPKKKKRSR